MTHLYLHQDGTPASRLRRTGKDSVFRDLFTQPKYLLQLYQTLHPEDRETTADDLEIVTIERVVTDGAYNDLGFTVAGRLLVLAEAQSTWSVNIVTRMLLYLAETYRRNIQLSDASLHDSSVVTIPSPELYVIYTGKRNVPETVSLAEDVLGGARSDVDVRVHVLRGGSDDVVGQYVEFARVFDEVASDDMLTTVDKVTEVVRRCGERGILQTYMQDRYIEVEDIMFTLFDQERETRLYHERLKKRAEEAGWAEGKKKGLAEGRKEGLAEGLAEGRKEGEIEGRGRAFAEAASQLMRTQGLTIDQALDAIGLQGDERSVVSALLANRLGGR